MPAIAIRFGGYQPDRSVHTRAVHRFRDELRGRLGGECEVRFWEDVTASGRTGADLLAMTEGDDLDLCYYASSPLALRVPTLAVFDLPFQLADRRTTYALLDGELGGRLAAEVAAATGFRVLSFWDNGIRHISNWKHPIRHPQDCRGLRVRTLDSANHQRVFRSLGFEPVVVDVGRLAVAVAERWVDAQENPLTNLINFDLHKTHRYVSLTGHFFGVAPVLCNRWRFDSWPTHVQMAVKQSLAAATTLQRRLAAEEDETCLAQLVADGVEITPADEIDRPAFLAAVAGPLGEVRRSLSSDLLRLVMGD